MIRILLTGFMASGKTTLGRALARDLQVTFIDLDSYIEQRFHTTISTLFAQKGEEGFRILERNMLHEVAEMEDVVIATGGGTPCWYDNMEYMNSQGTTVWLQASIEVLHRRLTINHSKRPLVAQKTPEELTQFIIDKLEERKEHYSKAQHTFCADELEDKRQIATSVKRFKQEIGVKATTV